MMKQRIAFLFVVVFASAVFAAAQSRTVTNVDLDRYRQQREAAAREYRENYARLGLPSPEELAARDMERNRNLFELSNKLRAEDLERERMEAAREGEDQRYETYSNRQPDYRSNYLVDRSADNLVNYGGGYYDNYDYNGYNGYNYNNGYNNSRRRNFRVSRQYRYQQPAYAAGGQVWFSGPRTAPQTVIRIAPRRR